MKAYITCPLSHSKEKVDLLPIIESVVQGKGIEAFVVKIGQDPKEIFNRDYDQLKSSDLIIAEVSERSHGVGAEIGLSYELGLNRILLIEKGQFVSKFIHGMPDTVILEYKNPRDLKEKLSSELDKIVLSSK